MKKIVVAIIGTGRIAHFGHGGPLSSRDDIRIKYACDILGDKAELYKKEYPKCEKVITDYHEALKDPEVNAVFVLTPNFEHENIAVEALNAGKHVFCEKPAAVNYPLVLKMKEAADKNHRILNIGVCNRFNKSVETLQEMNAQGKFGKIYHVYCSFRSCRAIPGLGGPFTDKKKSGGGVLIDWGVHFFDLILYVLGGATIKNVTCDAYSEMAKNMKDYKCHYMWAEDTKDLEHGTNDVEDFISGYVRTSKASISFNGAWAENLEQDEMFIDFLGDKGGARLSYGGLFTFFDGQTLVSEKPTFEIPNMYQVEDDAFFDSIRTGKKNKGNIDEILETEKLLDALYLSSKEKKEVTL